MHTPLLISSRHLAGAALMKQSSVVAIAKLRGSEMAAAHSTADNSNEIRAEASR